MNNFLVLQLQRLVDKIISKPSGHIIQDETTPMTDRPALNFAGEGVTVTDTSGTDTTTVTIPGGASVANVGSTAETIGGAVSNGSATTAARSDHKHGITNPMTTSADIIVGGVSGGPGRLAVGTTGQILSVASATTLGWVSPSYRWTEVTGFDDNPMSNFEIDITNVSDSDWASLLYKPIKFVLSGSATEYYAFCAARGIIPETGQKMIIINGAPLTDGDGDLQKLYFGTREMITIETFSIPGGWADNLSNTLLQSDLLINGGYPWCKGNAALVHIQGFETVVDSATTKAKFNIVNASRGETAYVCNTANGIVAATSISHTVVDIDTTNYLFNNNQRLEIACDTLATGGTVGTTIDTNLTVQCMFITY